MDSDEDKSRLVPPPSATPPPWQHRSWCARDCAFRPGAAEGAHLGLPWVLTPADEPSGRIALRLVEEPREDGPGEVRVLVSVTERRLPDDLDPFHDSSGQIGSGPADITSSVGLGPDEAGQVSEQLVAFAGRAREVDTEESAVAQPGGRALPRSEQSTGRERERIAARLRERYVQGATIRELVAQTGRSYGWVRTLLLEAGVVLRGRGGDHRERAPSRGEGGVRDRSASGDEPPAHGAMRLAAAPMPAAHFLHLLGELVGVPAVVPRRQDHRRGEQTTLDVAGQGAGLHADGLRGLRGGHQFGHQMTVRAEMARSNTAVLPVPNSREVSGDDALSPAPNSRPRTGIRWTSRCRAWRRPRNRRERAAAKYQGWEGTGMEVHSEGESFRRAHKLRTPDGSVATLLVLRRRTDVWLTFDGAEKTSVTMSCAETDDLIDTLSAARRTPR